MSNNENNATRTGVSPRSSRSISRWVVALVVSAVAVCVNATPVLASGATVPDAPTITGITIGRNTVTVGFSPNSDGGDPIAGYTVTCTSSDGGATQSNADVDSPITVSSLTNGNTYSCTVLATNSVGGSATSDPSDDFTAITVPDAPTVTGVTRGMSSAIVSFSANSDGGDAIVFYKVTCTSSTGGTTRSKTGTSSPLTVTSLSNGRTYTCAVIATNSIGDSAASVASGAFVAGTTPAAPTITGVTRGDNSAIVAVSPNGTGGSALTDYTATCTSSDGGGTESASDASSPITVSGLTNASTYTCTAFVTNAFGDSAVSAASGGFVAATMPEAPTLTSIDLGLNSVTVAFTANGTGASAITGYTVTCASTDGGATQSTTDAGSPITVGSLSNGSTYSCVVAASNAIGAGAASLASSTFVAATVPDAPTITGVVRGQNSAIVAFAANGDGSDPVTGFTVTCASSDGGTTRSASGATSPITVSSLTNTKTYTCTAVATNGFGDSAASVASAAFVAANVPDAPTLTSIDLGLNSVTVAFTANGTGGSAITGFTMTCASSDGGATQSVSDASSPITVSSLTNSKTYSCSAVATNATGDSAGSVASASFVAATVPDAPTISGVTRGNNSAIVALSANGDGGDGITGYTATCMSSDGGTTQSDTAAGSPITVASLTNSSTYTCTAVATNGFGDSTGSVASSSFVAATVPDAPTLTAADLGSDAVSIGVSPNANGGDAMTGYTATCTSSDGGTTRSATSATSPITVSSLTNGNTYTCTVIATNTVGDSAASGASNAFVAAGIADAPTITSVDLDLDAVTVGFTPNANGGDTITGYTVTCDSSDSGATQSNTDTTSPITVSSLTNGNTYTCTVVATNGYGDSAASDASSPFVAGNAPSAPTITGVTRGNNSATLAFTSNGDGGDPIIDYRVTCTSSNGGITRSKTGISSPIMIGALSNSRTYTCKIVAGNSIAASVASVASSPFVAATSPVAPTLATVTRGGNSAIVAFTANANGGSAITGFTATCASSDGGATQSASDTSSPITVSSLTNSKTYTCTAVASNAVADSTASLASDPFVAATSPPAPSVTGVTLGSNAATVAFTANGNAGDAITAFAVTCASSDGGATQSASDTSSPITVSALTNSKTYTCTVVATNGFGDSAASVASTSFVAGTVPDAPTLTGVTRGNNTAIVAFTANGSGGSAISGFTAACTSSNGGTTRTVTGTSSPLTVASLTNGSAYTCTVLATNGIGNGAASTASASFVAATSPPAPTITGVTRGSNSAIVAFTTNGDGGDTITAFTGVCTSSNGGATQSASGASSPITVSSLTNAKTYTCTVLATNGFGNSAASAASTSFVVAAAPSAPSITGVTHTSGSATVTFTAGATGGSPITSFTVTCTSSNGGTTRSATSTRSPITVTLLTAGKLYSCRVSATNAVGTSPLSIQFSFTD